VQIVKNATLGTCPYLLEQTLDKCINWHTRHMQEENCMVSIMGVFINWRLGTSYKFDRKAGFSDGDLTNRMTWCRPIHSYEQKQLMTLTSNPYDNTMTFYHTQLYI